MLIFVSYYEFFNGGNNFCELLDFLVFFRFKIFIFFFLCIGLNCKWGNVYLVLFFLILNLYF